MLAELGQVAKGRGTAKKEPSGSPCQPSGVRDLRELGHVAGNAVVGRV